MPLCLCGESFVRGTILGIADAGENFENDLYFADSHLMKIVIEADGVEKSRVQIKQTNARGAPFAGAMAAWVNEGSDDCAARS